jgi:hypothetical protein
LDNIKIDVQEMSFEDGIGFRSCPMLGIGISDVETFGCRFSVYLIS